METKKSSNSNKLIPAAGKTRSNMVEVLVGKDRHRAGLLRNLTRLAIGSTVLAVETVVDQLQKAEQATLLQSSPNTPQAKNLTVEVMDGQPAPSHSSNTSARHALIGLMFETQSRLGQDVSALLQAEQKAESRVSQALSPITNSKLFAPVRRRYETAVKRGKAQVNRWAELGRTEEAYSRALAHNTLDRLLNVSLDYATESPPIQEFIQEMVQTQSLGMADEAIEEVRERTVTGDILLERFVRSIFRRAPRESLPPPPTSAANQRARSKPER